VKLQYFVTILSRNITR